MRWLSYKTAVVSPFSPPSNSNCKPTSSLQYSAGARLSRVCTASCTDWTGGKKELKLTLRMNRFCGNFGTDHHHHVYSLPCAVGLGLWSVNFSHGSSTSFFHLDDGGMATVYDVHCRHSRTGYGLHLFAKWSYAVQGGKPVPAGQR